MRFYGFLTVILSLLNFSCQSLEQIQSGNESFKNGHFSHAKSLYEKQILDSQNYHDSIENIFGVMLSELIMYSRIYSNHLLSQAPEHVNEVPLHLEPKYYLIKAIEFRESGRINSAITFCHKALKIIPYKSESYLLKFMGEIFLADLFLNKSFHILDSALFYYNKINDKIINFPEYDYLHYAFAPIISQLANIQRDFKKAEVLIDHYHEILLNPKNYDPILNLRFKMAKAFSIKQQGWLVNSEMKRASRLYDSIFHSLHSTDKKELIEEEFIDHYFRLACNLKDSFLFNSLLNYSKSIGLNLKKAPTNLNYFRGYLYFNLGNYEEAIRYYQRVYTDRYDPKLLTPYQYQSTVYVMVDCAIHLKKFDLSRKLQEGIFSEMHSLDISKKISSKDLISSPFSYLGINQFANTYLQEYTINKKIPVLKKAIDLYNIADSSVQIINNNNEYKTLHLIQLINSFYNNAASTALEYYLQYPNDDNLNKLYYYLNRFKSTLLNRNATFVQSLEPNGLKYYQVYMDIFNNIAENKNVTFTQFRKVEQISKNLKLNYEIEQSQYLSPKDIQKNMDKATQIIEYNILKERLIIFTISNEKITCNQFLLDSLLMQNLSWINQIVLNNGPPEPEAIHSFQSKTNYCYKKLVKPYIEDSKYDQITFVSNHPLFDKFHPHVFVYEIQSDMSNWRDLSYLGLHYSISFTYSTRNLIKKKTKRTKGKFILAGVTEYKSEKTPPLPYVRSEIRFIEKIFDNSVSLFQKNFNTSNFLKHIDKDTFDVVHIATHSFYDDSNLLNNYILTHKDTISIFDIKKMNFKRSTVVLSSCDGSSGFHFDREGKYNLINALIGANASGVLTTSGQISDFFSSYMMKRIYQEYSSNQNFTTSLTSTINHIMKDSDVNFSSPHYWGKYKFFKG